MKFRLFSVLLISTLALGGCNSTQSLYHWGGYEEQVYRMYAKPEKATPAQQVEVLEKDMQIAKANGLSVPPGFYAHLGYQHYQMGDTNRARSYFELEKQTFPESTTYVNLMLKKIK